MIRTGITVCASVLASAVRIQTRLESEVGTRILRDDRLRVVAVIHRPHFFGDKIRVVPPQLLERLQVVLDMQPFEAIGKVTI
jgi:hypothetical protein